MIKIGITGGTGILGRNLIKFIKLKTNYKVIKYRNNILNKKKVNIWVKKNQFNIIIHLAAIVPTSLAKKKFIFSKNVNFIGTKYLVNAINEHQIRKNLLFFSSTSHVYSFLNRKINESEPTKGVSLYGKTKILAENYILNNCKSYDFCIGRISSLVSEEQDSNYVLKKIIHKCKKDKKITFGNSNIKRNFIYVDDVSKIIIKILRKKIVGIINISNTEITDFGNLFNFLQKKYSFNITHYKKKKNYLLLSNKLLYKKIGKYNFISIKDIIDKIYNF